MFFSNQENKAKLKAIDRTYAVIHFKPDGTIIKANENFLKAMGYKLNEITHKHHSIFCDKRFVQSEEYKEFWDKLNKGVSFNSEFKRIKKNGESIFLRASYIPLFDNNNKIFEVIKLAQDITEKRLGELFNLGQINAINKSQAVIEFNMDGIILNANENFLKTLNYSLDEIVGKHHSMFCEESYKNSQAYKDFWKKLNKGEFDSGEYLRIGKGGKVVWIQATYNPILDLDGVPFKIVKYATDITLKKNTMVKIGEEIEELTKSLTQLKNSSTTMVNEAQISMSGTKDIASAIENLNESANELSKKVEFMLSSITNIANTTKESEKSVLEARNQSKETTSSMLKLNEESTKIGETINIISQIAFQTNILSLNAAVEAATAGEAGKGFAVVAQEVRNLATRSNEAAKDITEAIEYIQTLVKSSLESINQIDNKIENISSMSSTISNSINEQKNISNDLSRTASLTSQTLNSITQNMTKVSNSAIHTDKEAKITQENSNELINISNKLIGTLKVLQ